MARASWAAARASGPAARASGRSGRCSALLLIGTPLACVGRAAGDPPATDAPSLRIVAYNIRHGAGMDEGVDLERIADALRPLNADVVTLQEVDHGTVEAHAVVEEPMASDHRPIVAALGILSAGR